MLKIYYNQTLFYEFSLLRQFDDLKHVVSTRNKQNFNIATHLQDRQQAINNRQLVCQYMQVSATKLTLPKQIHSDNIAIVTDKNCGQAITDVDALITKEVNIPIGAFAADCPLIGFFDCKQRIIAVAHAGWRGTVEQIAAKTVKKMIKIFATQPKDIYACIAPAIGPCCYNIQQDVIERVTKLPNGRQFLVMRNSQVYFDLWSANYYQLQQSGIQNITCAQICTRCHNNIFYSCRSEGIQTGRFGFFITMLSKEMR